MPVDQRRRKTEAFQRTRCTGIAQRRAHAKKLFGSQRYAFVFPPFASVHADLCRIAIDAAPYEFGDEPRVAECFRAAFDEKTREQDVVDEAVALAGRNRCVNVIVGETLAR